MPKFPFSFPFRNAGTVRDLGQAMTLGLPVLGAIRAFEPETGSSLPGEQFPEALEAYRRLVETIRVPDFHVRARTIVVTCAESGGDKSSVAANLATLLARGGSRVVLVAADLRLTTRRKAGDGSTSSGFAGLLVNQLRPASDALVHTLEPKLKLLPMGSATATPATLFRSPRLPLVVDQLRALADHVIFDVPSVVAWEESLRLVHQADVTLLVVEAGLTRRSAARQAASKLKAASAGTLGVVLNRAPAWVGAAREEGAWPAPAALPVEQVAEKPAPERLELAVDELLADLEEALKLIRSIRQVNHGTEAPKEEQETELAAIDS
jgi:Mrp family chromosome partitioning ATPase